jgi:hypothetical protein
MRTMNVARRIKPGEEMETELFGEGLFLFSMGSTQGENTVEIAW